MKFSMLESFVRYVVAQGPRCSTNSLHPSSQTRAAEDDLLAVAVNDFGALDLQERHAGLEQRREKSMWDSEHTSKHRVGAFKPGEAGRPVRVRPSFHRNRRSGPPRPSRDPDLTSCNIIEFQGL